MRTLLVLTGFFAMSFALSQDHPIAKIAHALKDCQSWDWADDTNAIVMDTLEFINDIGVIQETAVEEGLKCAKDYEDSATLVACVSTTVTDWIDSLLPTVQKYIVNVVSKAEDLVDDIYDCIHD